ncbi:hypothetical protein [Tenacibaculum halocynthiae]|uniref:hypothetical protein n=1 Tax=Tenacibaculum halocynthiae TaxID=1254437 RepID=UPI003D65B9A0
MKQDKKTIKTYFETGDKPTQQQFADLIDSYVDSKQGKGEANRRFVIDAAGEVNLTSEQKIPEYTLSEITGNKLALLKDGATVKEIDLTPYIDDTNLARLVSGIVDANGMATFTRDDNTTFTVDLNNLKSDAIQYQAGENITINKADPENPVINSSLKDGVRYEGRSPFDGESNDNWSVSVIPKKSVFTYSGSAINNEPIILLPRVTYGTTDMVVDTTILVMNETPVNIQTSFRVSGNADSNTLGTNFFQGTMLTSELKDLKVEIGIFERNSNKFLALKYTSNETNISNTNLQKVITINKITVRPHSLLDQNNVDELHNNTDLDLAVNGVFIVQNTVQGNDLLPNAKLNGVQSIVAGTNVTIDNTDPQKPIINATSANNSVTNLSYNASTRTVESSNGNNVVLPLADTSNAGLMKADFYKEGTWAPIISSSTNGSSQYSSTGATGIYKIIGNVFHYSIQLTGIVTNGDLSGYTYISLPDIVGNSLFQTNSTLEQIFLGSGREAPKDYFTPQITSENSKRVIYLSTYPSTNFYSADFNNGFIKLSGTLFLK